MTEKKTYEMYIPSRTSDGRASFAPVPLEHATTREEAKAIGMAMVRTRGLEEAFFVEQPGDVVYSSYPFGKKQ